DQTKKAITAIRENRMADFICTVLVYYDKAYHKGLSMRAQEKVFLLEDAGASGNTLLSFAQTINL
ncbi:MAG TPA: hypothetical protein VL092_09690, partial [Chitinophagaceae bacterium]|nr:hypothetical protein [Chitinophagaceae bacterium]